MSNPLPLFLSIPHAGTRVPDEVQDICQLSSEQIRLDGDLGAAEIYSFKDHVINTITTDVARAVVDLNRSEDDRRPDGVVKTHTIFDEPIYTRPLSGDLVETLLDRYYRPYHKMLHNSVDCGARLFVDCHTMAEFGPPVGPDPGEKRPMVCLGDCNGTSIPKDWMTELKRSFERSFDFPVTVNSPFAGGHITRTYKKLAPWVQIEISRSNELTLERKRQGVLEALTSFCHRVFGNRS